MKLTDWVSICHTSKQVSVTTHSVSLKCAASGDCFYKRNLWSGSLNSKTLASDLPLESYPTFVYKRRSVCSSSVSSQSWANRHELRADALIWLTILITLCKMLLHSGDIFHLASISLRITQCLDSHSEASSLIGIVKRESRSVMAASPSVHIPTEMPNSGVLCNHSKTWIVLWLWCWLATKLHITYPHAHPLKNRFLKNKIVALLSIFIDLSAWIAYHLWQLCLSVLCYFINSSIVLAERGARVTFWTAASPKSSWQTSLAVGRINSSPTLLSSSMWVALSH